MSVGKSYVYAYGQLLQETSVVRADGINRRDNLAFGARYYVFHWEVPIKMTRR